MYGYEPTNSDHKNLSWPDHINNTVGVFEDLEHHFFFISGRWLIVRVRTRMNNAIHVKIKIV